MRWSSRVEIQYVRETKNKAVVSEQVEVGKS